MVRRVSEVLVGLGGFVLKGGMRREWAEGWYEERVGRRVGGSWGRRKIRDTFFINP